MDVSNAAPTITAHSSTTQGGTTQLTSSNKDGFFLRIRGTATVGKGGKRAERDNEEVEDPGVEAAAPPPPRRIQVDIDGTAYRFKRLTEEEWLKRRVGGGGTGGNVSSTAAVGGAADSATASSDVVASPPPTSVATDENAVAGPPSNATKNSFLTSSVCDDVTVHRRVLPKPTSTSKLVGVKATPLPNGETVTENVRRRNTDQRKSQSKLDRRALHIEAIQTYRLLSNKAVRVNPGEREERGKRDREEGAIGKATLLGRGVVVTASFALPSGSDANGGIMPPKSNNKPPLKPSEKRRPVPAVQGRGAATDFHSPTSATPVAAPHQASKPNPMRNLVEQNLDDYYLTVLAADRKSRLSGRGALTDAQLERLLLELAIQQQEKVANNIVADQMSHAQRICTAAYPPPTAPPAREPPREADTSYADNKRLVEEYRANGGGNDDGGYYYALDDGDLSDDEYESDDEVTGNGSDAEDSINDVLGGRFRGNSRYCFRLLAGDEGGFAEADGDIREISGPEHRHAYDGAEGEEGDEDDFKFVDLAVEPHRQYMAQQWESQPTDVAAWHATYDLHSEGRDVTVAGKEAKARKHVKDNTAPSAALNTIKGYLELAASSNSKHYNQTCTDEGAEWETDDEEPEFVLDAEPAYVSTNSHIHVGRMVRSNLGGEDPEVLYADNDEYDSNAEDNYQGEYPEESLPSTSSPSPDSEDVSSDEDSWNVDGDAPQKRAVHNLRRHYQGRRRRRGQDEDEQSNADEGNEDYYYDPTALGADDGLNGLEGFVDDEHNMRRGGKNSVRAEELSAEGILKNKVVYYEHPESDDDEY